MKIQIWLENLHLSEALIKGAYNNTVLTKEQKNFNKIT